MKENIVYDRAYFQKQGSLGGKKLKELKKDDPEFYKSNGIKGAKKRWAKKK